MVILPNVNDILEKNFNFYRTLSDNYKFQLTNLISTTIQGINKHNQIKRVKHLGTCSLYSKDLIKRFTEYRLDYKDVIYQFYDIIDNTYNNTNPDKSKRHTKYYKLKDSVIDCLIRELKYQPTILVDNRTKKKIHQLPKNSIRKTYTDKKSGITKRCKSIILMDTWVKGNEELIDDYIVKLESVKDSVSELIKPTLQTYLLELCSIKSLMNNNLNKGYLPQIYQEQDCGRLGGKGFHLLNIKKKIRFIFFGNMNLYDYDISNCHYSLFSNLSKQHGYCTDGIDYYLRNKKVVRKTLSDDLELTIKQVKVGLISLMYGNSLKISEFNSLWDEFQGEEPLRKFFEHKIIKKLIEDIKEGTKLIVGKTPVTKQNQYGMGIKNVVGKTRFLYDEDGLVSDSQLLSHLLSGWERKLMEYISSILDEKMIGMYYDGWISKEVDTEYIIGKIKDKFDFDISIDSELIIPPKLSDLGISIIT